MPRESYNHARVSDHDAWILARARAGHDRTEGILRATPPLQPLALKLAQAPARDRAAIFDEHLKALTEQRAGDLLEALAAVDPDDPKPPRDDGWLPPFAFRLPPVWPCPVDLFPEPLARRIEHGARALGCPPDSFALPALVVAGAAVGRAVALKLKDVDFDREVKNVACEVKGSDVTLWDSLTRKRKGKLGPVGSAVVLDTLHQAAALGREQNTGVAQAALKSADLLGDTALMTALETLLNVLPPPALAAKGKADDGGLPGAASDFDALEKLRRLAFAESVPAPHVQLELNLQPAEAQGELGFDDGAGDLDGEGPDDE